MTSQRPAWFRLTSLAIRPPAPAPTPPPPPTSASVPFPPRPTIPITRAQEPRATPLPQSPPASLPPSPPLRAPLTTPAPTPTPNISPVPTPVAAPLRPNPVSARATPTQNSPVTNLTELQPTVAAAPPPPRSPAVLPPVIPRAPPQSPAALPAPHLSPQQISAPAPKFPTPSNSSTTTNSTYSPRSPPKSKTQNPSSSLLSKQPSPVPTPIPSPKTIKPNSQNNSPSSSSSSSSHSPKYKPVSHPPSPLTLPPPQLKSDGEVNSEPRIEQKNVLVQEPIGNKLMKPTHNPHNHTSIASRGKKEPISPINYHKKPSDEFGMRVITLAGENKGAVMELITPSQKKSNGKKVGSQSSSESGMEGKSKSKGKNDEAMAGFFNSNVQGVNNSILYHTHCRHNDPGIHLSLTRKPNGDRDHHG